MKKNTIYSLILILLFSSIMSACQEIDRSGRPFRTINNDITDPDDDDDDDKVIPERPANAVFIQPGTCGCQNGKPIVMGNCASVCSSKPTSTQEMLYMSVKLGEAIELSDMKDLYGWCLTVLTDPETGEPLPGQANPGCVLEAKDNSDNTYTIPLNPSAGSKNLTVDISGILDPQKNYRLTIVESSSGVRSNTAQIFKYSEDPNQTIEGPMWLSPISQYTCFVRVTSQDDTNGNLYFDDAYRLHFYFGPGQKPDPIPRSIGNLFCHDIFKYGTTDRETFPRLEETPNTITLWDKEDPRFYDLSGNETGGPNAKLDIHDIITKKVRQQGNTISDNLEIFHEFTWPGAPELNAEAGNSAATNLPLGFYMVPWIDKTNYRAYCPNETEHYYSSNPIFRALGEVLGLSTEGLYIAKKEAQTIVNENGEQGIAPEDYILIRESQLKKIWFYIENETHYTPTDSNVKGKKIQFYWPANPSSPHVKQSHQRLYTVKSATELSNSGSNIDDNGGADTGNGGKQNYPPHDKRIGCIPFAEASSN